MKLIETNNRGVVETVLTGNRIDNLSLLGAISYDHSRSLKYFTDCEISPSIVLLKNWWTYLFTEKTESAREYLSSLEPGKEHRFAALASRYIEFLKCGRKTLWEQHCIRFFLDRKNFQNIQKHKTEPLRAEHADLVARHWENKDSKPYVLERIIHGPTVAVYENGEPVSWALTHEDGQMGFMYTMETCRGKGYARTITSAMSKIIFEQGEIPFLHVLKKNYPAAELVTRSGFQPCGEYYYIRVE